ncbi:MAG TPA: protein kinase, partial [Pyrinomonadaceae bacterium]|nr:protein kinase [Pyrinomonadaceae bacterium]
MTIPQGTRLGRYEVHSSIGVGGMGEVYLAEDVRLGRTIALKILPAEMASDLQRMSRFMQEARATSALNHPNIITIHEIDQTDSLHFIITEFIDGVTLRGRMKAARIEIGEALDITAQVVSALAAAHSAGIVHRDIKPENVMLRSDGLVKVLDFGIAKLTDRMGKKSQARVEAETLLATGEGVIVGTVSYMSPEQARAEMVDERTDLWSVRVMLYEMLAGHRPFGAATPVETLALILNTEPVPLTRAAQDIPAELNRIVHKTLAKNRDVRYRTAEELLLDLRRLMHQINFEKPFEGSLVPEHLSSNSIERGANQGSHADTVIGSDAFEMSAGASELTAAAAEHPNNLSAEMTLLIGREHETAELRQMLGREDVRLVTLTGIGGTGKTRLARRVARALLAEFASGVFFIDLSAISEPGLVASTVAQPLGVKETGSAPLVESLKEYLRDKQMLLVLDNFEQVLEAAPFVAELLSSSPKLKMIVTSRISLHLSAEHEYMVSPLALPETEQRLPPLTELMNHAAIALFVKRAQAIRPTFALTEENALSVVEVCRRLDGLPLAIELAAARIKLLSPQAILTRLEHSLKLLTGGARDLPARQQTMRGAISWSYDLLEEGERRLLNRLSVFAGGMTIEAAEKVCDDGGVVGEAESASRDQHPAIDILDAITSLVDKSLLMQKEQGDVEPRLRMLELVREYATECLEQSNEALAVRDRHADFYLRLVEEAQPELLGGAKVGNWLNRLEEEHDNLRAALRWLLERDAEKGLRLAAAARPFWERRGHLTEGRAWLAGALLKGGAAQAPSRAKALHGAAQLAWQQGELAAARILYEEALRLSRKAGDRRLVAMSSRGLGTVAFIQGNLAAARPLLEESLAVCREINDTRGVSTSLITLGEMARTEGRLEAARALYEESLALCRQSDNQYNVCVNLLNLGAVACLEEDLKAACACHREAILIAEKLGDGVQVAYALNGFGALLVLRGEMWWAARLFGAAEHLLESIGYELEPQDREFRERY